MEYECILCGKVVDTENLRAPAGWQMYHDIWICEECSNDLGGKLDLLEFLRDLDSARLALTFAQKYNVPKDIKDKIEGLISEIRDLIDFCRKEEDVIDAERFDIVLIS